MRAVEAAERGREHACTNTAVANETRTANSTLGYTDFIARATRLPAVEEKRLGSVVSPYRTGRGKKKNIALQRNGAHIASHVARALLCGTSCVAWGYAPPDSSHEHDNPRFDHGSGNSTLLVANRCLVCRHGSAMAGSDRSGVGEPTILAKTSSTARVTYQPCDRTPLLLVTHTHTSIQSAPCRCYTICSHGPPAAYALHWYERDEQTRIFAAITKCSIGTERLLSLGDGLRVVTPGH